MHGQVDDKVIDQPQRRFNEAGWSQTTFAARPCILGDIFVASLYSDSFTQDYRKEKKHCHNKIQ